MDERPTLTLPRGAGTAIFAGGGAWLPRSGLQTSEKAPGAATDATGRPDPGCAVLLSNPLRVLVATRPDEIEPLLADIEAAQLAGRYVAGYLAYEAGAVFGLTVRQGNARPLAPEALDCTAAPLAWMAVYAPESAVMVPEREWARYLDAVDVSAAARLLATVKPELNVSEAAYSTAIGLVRQYIATPTRSTTR